MFLNLPAASVLQNMSFSTSIFPLLIFFKLYNSYLSWTQKIPSTSEGFYCEYVEVQEQYLWTKRDFISQKQNSYCFATLHDCCETLLLFSIILFTNFWCPHWLEAATTADRFVSLSSSYSSYPLKILVI